MVLLLLMMMLCNTLSLSPKSEQPKTGREKGGGVEERLPLLLLLLTGWLEEQDEGRENACQRGDLATKKLSFAPLRAPSSSSFSFCRSSATGHSNSRTLTFTVLEKGGRQRKAKEGATL